ncbi:hypothetical protein BDK51DRAFT_42251 [Blyttiomyces helicus]|uniref:Uncharacterized protein n=1 Tax=Blyttiomyces helicus TaxID=388810 RepID=A0A4P9VX03_9FUNG|nr:hypothetical protein BDK51DRAFT_42251 [Blyttiomyces helicus]|eukprot:RKO82800.1 hypothetical protein BDK51DRAFT_42251 [Blyttiomyces helicus]
MTNWRDDLQNHVLLTMYFTNYLYAKESGFDRPQMGAFFSIIKTVLDRSVGKDRGSGVGLGGGRGRKRREAVKISLRRMLPSFQHSPSLTNAEKALPLEKSVALFKSLLLGHSQWGDQDAALFGAREVKLVMDYCINGMFQHYRIYQYVLTTEQEKQDLEVTIAIEQPPVPPRPAPSPAFSSMDFVADTSRLSVTMAPRSISRAPSILFSSGAQGGSGGSHLDLSGAFSGQPHGRATSSVTLDARDAEILPVAGWPPPLAEAMTLEAHEEEQERIRLKEEMEKAEEERRIAEEKAAAANPFDVLSPEEVKQIAADTVAAILAGVSAEFEKLLELQRTKFMQALAKTI